MEHDYRYIYMLWVKVMYEDACTGYSYSLDTVTGYRSMWKSYRGLEVFKRKKTLVFRKYTHAA